MRLYIRAVEGHLTGDPEIAFSNYWDSAICGDLLIEHRSDIAFNGRYSSKNEILGLKDYSALALKHFHGRSKSLRTVYFSADSVVHREVSGLLFDPYVGSQISISTYTLVLLWSGITHSIIVSTGTLYLNGPERTCYVPRSNIPQICLTRTYIWPRRWLEGLIKCFGVEEIVYWPWPKCLKLYKGRQSCRRSC